MLSVCHQQATLIEYALQNGWNPGGGFSLCFPDRGQCFHCVGALDISDYQIPKHRADVRFQLAVQLFGLLQGFVFLRFFSGEVFTDGAECHSPSLGGQQGRSGGFAACRRINSFPDLFFELAALRPGEPAASSIFIAVR